MYIALWRSSDSADRNVIFVEPNKSLIVPRHGDLIAIHTVRSPAARITARLTAVFVICTL